MKNRKLKFFACWFFFGLTFCSSIHSQVFVSSDTGIKFISNTDSSDVEKINFLGKKTSLKYIPALLESGRKIKVPIVNDLVPVLELHAFDDGSLLRIYHYDRREKYSGEQILKFKKISSKSSIFDITPSLDSEKAIFQEPTPATGLTN